MTPQAGHIYQLNTGHRVVCTYVGAITALYTLPLTGKPLALRIDAEDDTIRIAQDLSDPNLSTWLELWNRGLVVEWIGAHPITGVTRDSTGLITGIKSGPTRTDAMLRLLQLARN